MALKLNPNYNPSDLNSQRYIFSEPTVINQQTGQTLTSQTLAPVAPLKVETLVAPFFPNIANLPTTPAPTTPAPTPSPATDLTSQLESLQAELLGAPAAKAETVSGATAKFQKQLDEINAQIRMHQATALERQEKALATGETLGFAAGEAQRIARTDAIEAMKLSSLAQAMQGNISTAEKLAGNAADAEFAEKLQKLAITRNNIIANWDTFTAAEKKRAQATLESIDAQDAFVVQQKQESKDIQGVARQAAQLGANNVLLNKILQAPSTVEADRLLAESGLTIEPAEIAGGIEMEKFKQFFPDVDLTTPEGQQQWLNWKAKESAAGRKPEEPEKEINQILYSVGLPYTIVNNKGQLTDSHLSKLGASGIPPNDAQEIMDEIIAGKTLEEIRQWMRNLGVDPAILDTFMTTLQGQGEEEIINPFI